MIIKYAENRITAEYDKKATEYLQKVIAWEKQAEKAPSDQRRKKYWSKAHDFRKKAIDALETAKSAAETRCPRK